MPTTLNFASAAAGNSNDVSGRSNARQDGGSTGDWSRRPNGSTQTFRRTSTATSQSNIPHPREPGQMQPGSTFPSVGAYVPPHLTASRAAVDTRYSREQLLDLYRDQKEAGDLRTGLEDLLVGDWSDSISNGVSSARWGRREEVRNDNAYGPEICWERGGTTEPLALYDMTDEEHELFSTSVNSPLKGVQPSAARDTGSKDNPVGRKMSVSHNPMYGLSSPTAATRPSNRRREPSESYPFPREGLASPTADASRQDAQDYGFLRRRTDTSELEPDRPFNEREKDTPGATNNVFGSLKRSGTNPLSAGLNGPTSPWTSSNPSAPMGAFGNFGAGVNRRPDTGPSRESRFRDILGKAGMNEEPQDDHRLGGLGRLDEDPQDLHRNPSRQNTGPTMSSLGGLSDDSPQQREIYPAFGNPARKQAEGSDFGSYAQRAFTDQQTQHDAQQAFQSDQDQDADDPSSPTFTNPYASPQQAQRLANARAENEDQADLRTSQLPGLGSLGQQPPKESFPARVGLDRMGSFGPHRGQAFGAGSSRGFPSLSGLGPLPGLGGAPDPWAPRSRTGTPNRERGGLGDFTDHSVRSPAATFQSPGGAGPFTGGFGTGGLLGRNRGLGSLVPNQMQDQNQNREEHSRLYDDSEAYDDRGRSGLPSREIDSPYQGDRNKLDEYMSPFVGREQEQSYDDQGQTTLQNYRNAPGQPLSHQPSFQQQSSKRSISVASSGPGQPPAAQQKTMVMPDRIRWIYRDPQGNIQGPWSGLEMHDWYRAGFFSPELLVRKLEDQEYEPLAQLIRRIGNSREPFLVPQIGIAYESSTQGTSPWPTTNTVSSPSTVSAATQPPFAGSFPSFGTTLTADQQNALERRKQEEQTLMARQKEHLAYQQVLARTGPSAHGHSQQLNHHSSAQSLNSQPSYGSMTSPPTAYPATSPPNLTQISQGGSGRFDGGFGARGVGPIGSGMDNLGKINEEEASGLFERMDLRRTHTGQQLPPLGRQGFEHDAGNNERTYQMLADRARLQREQEESQLRELGEDEHQRSYQSHERLQEFRRLQSQQLDDEAGNDEPSYITRQLGKTKDEHVQEAYDATAAQGQATYQRAYNDEPQTPQKSLSLTEQVQKAASAKQSPAMSAWPKVPEAVPPQSSSPLPAPAARRGGPSLAESLAVETLPHTETPSIETPTTTSSLAPWAKEQQESHKQPSLKEIQEAEAKRAAKHEQVLAAARRQALERETLAQPPPPAPGLPSSSTWGKGDSPLTTPTAAAASPWAKSAATKVATVPTTGKKTLQQIQQEEEAAAKKRKAQVASNATMAGQVVGAAQAMSAGGKRYADLAGKAASTPSPPMTGAWTTVGASGKVKTPAAAPAAVTLPAPLRTSSSSNISVSTTKSKPSSTASKTSLAMVQQQAQEDVKKWAIGELRPDLNKSIAVGDFVSSLLAFPADIEIITEVVHQNSSTMDSRHFAEEFVRKRSLADKGKMDTANMAAHHSSEAKNVAGWSEVARKGSAPSAPKAEDSAFKIVAGKKKAGKK